MVEKEGRSANYPDSTASRPALRILYRDKHIMSAAEDEFCLESSMIGKVPANTRHSLSVIFSGSLVKAA